MHPFVAAITKYTASIVTRCHGMAKRGGWSAWRSCSLLYAPMTTTPSPLGGPKLYSVSSWYIERLCRSVVPEDVPEDHAGW